MKHACRKVSRLASDALDRKLSPLERLRLHFHLLLCVNCRNFRSSLQRLHETFEHIRSVQAHELKLTKDQRRRLLMELERKLGD
ncbi:MAG: zf-HC2 domain-containing protein [Zetaproteobacteria bacterium]|nr:MAG: zf-HC2 domain-containing protein [Zetaproteobacteria bacterium]